MEDCGAVYRENGEARDPFALFGAHGANLGRARLWHNPDWTDYSTLDDVKRTFARAQQAGMSTLLDIHYSDNWADPGRQEIPAAWQALSDEELPDALYQYTQDVLSALHADGLMPTFVQVGNETNSGLLKRDVELNWPRDATLFNAGIRAVRDVAAATGTAPKIVLHVAQPENTGWWFTQAEAAGITDFDVIGLSYYPQWSTFSIADTGAQISALRQRFGKDVMIVETGYGWTRDAVDETTDNILDQGLRGYPFTPAGQRRFMTDLTQSVISNGGLGVVYWEPAWVSTGCSTRWGQGSRWANATFFDFQNDNELLEVIDYLSHAYAFPGTLVDGVVEAAYGEALSEDAASDSLESIAALDLSGLYAAGDASFISVAVTISGNVNSERGNYLIYLDTSGDDEGADVDVGKRPITVAEPFRPEYRLDIGIREQRGTISGSYVLNAWAEGEWQTAMFTGGASIHAGQPSVIEIQIPRSVLNDPSQLSIAVVSTDRTRIHTAGDILGTPTTPSNWEEAVVLDTFFSVSLSE
jgi:arabinogalactan endo-1,4-beta-galactosidase